MSKTKLIKKIASSLALAAIFSVYPTGANAEWKQDSIGWRNAEGSSWTSGWKHIDGKWYYFNQYGYMAHDTLVDGYELGSDGALITQKDETPHENFTMKTEKAVYTLGTKKINVNITNNTNLSSSYGAEYTVEKFENNEWHKLDFKEHTSFIELATLFPAKTTNTETFYLSKLQDFENLTPGKYRILFDVNNSNGVTRLAAEFELH